MIEIPMNVFSLFVWLLVWMCFDESFERFQFVHDPVDVWERLHVNVEPKRKFSFTYLVYGNYDT